MEIRGKFSRRLGTLFNSKTKGSRVLRMAIKNFESKEYFKKDVRTLQAVERLGPNEKTELDRELVEEHMGLWGKMYPDPGFRDFLFSYTQGRLHVNQTRAAYKYSRTGSILYILCSQVRGTV